ncbi:hypothetical protein QOZ80_6BG0482880 [Eleusine coracana subsp. coracana]|nr:hypothetical protein QOZ80_6BG0482880 [Eleusine coracana subsp. coracana]
MALKGMTMPRPSHLMAQPQPTSLEVTVVSGESVRLRSGRKLGRGAYAVVQTASSSAITHIDEDGDCGGYPFWDEPVRVELPAGARAIDVEICRSSGGRGESVAAARVPVEDFSVGPPGYLHCLSYRLHDTGGMRGRNGIVNITVKRIVGEGKAPAAEGKMMPAMGKPVGDAGASGSGSCYDHGKPIAAVPPAAAGVVIGYPVGIDFSVAGHAGGKGGV